MSFFGKESLNRKIAMVAARAVVLGCLVFGQPGLAREDVVPGSRYTSARAAAMGDAYLPLGDDGASGLFYNPASLGRIRGAQVEPLNLSMYANSAYASMMGGLDFYKFPSLSQYASTLQKHPGDYAGAGFGLFSGGYMRGFAVGALLQSHLAARANADGSISYRSLYQFVPTIGTGWRLGGGVVRIGYSLQWVNQASGSLTVPSGTEPLGYNQAISQGSALSHNIGFALTLPVAYLPSVNFVGRNLLTAKFSSFSLLPLARNSSGPPPDEQATYDVSFSVQPKLGSGSYVNFVLEYRDVTNVSGVSLWGRAVAGTEFSIKDSFFIRGGWGGGYPSAGIGIRKKGGEFALTWYSEEVGAGYHDLRDQRFLMQYQVRAF